MLPVGAYTQFYWTVQRALADELRARCATPSSRSSRSGEYAEAVEAFFAELMPVTHASFVENGRVAP